ncbi:MAG: EAL domain-containing protein [Actinomycetota bacterium]|nr:EAL domain-containing protein [Actinomycetota bacterium]
MSRSASIVLGVLLLAVCAFGIGWSQEVSKEITVSEQAAIASDLFESAHANAVLEDAELNTYRLDRTLDSRQEHDRAAATLARSLRAVNAHESAHPGHAAEINGLIIEHNRYQVLADRVIRLVDAGRTAEADRLAQKEVEPLRDALVEDLDALKQEHRLSQFAALHQASADGALLRIGTPIALALALLLLGGLAIVSRGDLRRARRHALHDLLTGLPNRLLFADRAGQVFAAARRSGAHPVVMMLDLDRFKEVNDTLGHYQGDELLVQVADRLAGVVRPGDTVARFGGDEFALLLADGGPLAGTRVAKRIAAALEPAFSLDGVTVGVEASIGIASEPGDDQPGADVDASERVDELLRHADTAMYQAKAERCGYSHFVGGGDDDALNHLALLGELRMALDRDELVVHYQPKVAADTGELLGVEALVRWQHPTRGLLAPAEFIGLAEGTTLIHRLTTVVLDKALAFSRGWLDQGVRLPVAVNISARSLLDSSFPASLGAQLIGAGLPAELLCLELTESTIMANPDLALAILRDLRAMGIRLSLDDFGTGYSSMAYLKILPVDELKVDRSFIRDVTTNDSDAVLVQSAIDLGHNLGLTVVAEGVEDSATLIALKTLGADIIQGYYLGHPMPAGQLGQWMTDRTDVLAADVANQPVLPDLEPV